MPLGAVPFPFGICRICRDKATGLHYGVATCEGCKGFFKRNIAKGETFECHFGGSCDITPKTRSHCKACRFKRCMKTGMSIDGVRMGRVPKTEKEKVLEAFQEGGADSTGHELVLERLGDGNFKFELNKTTTVTNSTKTFTSAPISNFNTTEVSLSEIVTTSRSLGLDSKLNNPKQTTAESTAHLSSLVAIKTNNDQMKVSRNTTNPEEERAVNGVDVNGYYGHYPSSISNAIGTEIMKANGNVYDGNYAYRNSTDNTMCKFKITPESEKCENPFNDSYAVRTMMRAQDGTLVKSRQDFRTMHHSWPSNVAFPSHESNCNHLSAPNNCCTCTSSNDRYTHNAHSSGTNPQLKQDVKGHLKEIPSHLLHSELYGHSMIEHERKATNTNLDYRDRVLEMCNKDHPGFSMSTSESSRCSDDSDDQNLHRRNSFSPALINALLEQVLDSNETVHAVTEKIHQKQKQGNFTPSFAQTLCQHITEVSAKRRKISGCEPPTTSGPHLHSHPPNALNVTIDSTKTGHTRTDDLKAAKKECGKLDRPYFEHQEFDSVVPWNRKSSLVAMDAEFGDKSERELSPLVSSGVISSSLPSEDSIQKTQDIKASLDGIAVGMTVLHRLKPEHRIKIKQFKEGKLKLRVMTDSEEDVKETYNKVINSIPNINERILGFCNNVPQFPDLDKEDKDTLMKRAYYDIWMLSYSEYFEDGESYMVMDTGEIYSQKTMRKILNDDMVDKIMEFANQFNSLELTDLEISILCAVRLTCTDNLELSDRTKVAELHSHLLDVFAFEVEKNHETTHARKLIDTFRLMPLLEVVNRIQRDIISKYSV